MNSYIVVPVFIVFLALGIITFFDIPQADDLALSNNSKIYAGEYEACLTPYTQIECKEGLECILISEKPQKNGMCLKPGTVLKEDFINRYMENQVKQQSPEEDSIDLGEIAGLN